MEGTVVVIGAGLSGMAAALAAARAGHAVTLVEATDAVGGCCSTVRQRGYTFNNGAIYVAIPSLLRDAFERLGLDATRAVPMTRIARPHATWLDDGTVVHLSSADGSYVEGDAARRRTASLRDGLRALQADWGPVYRALVGEVLPFEPSLAGTLGSLWRHLWRLRGHVDTVIAGYFPDPGLQAAVASTLLYTGQPPQRLPATQIIGLLALLEEGFHLPVAGMGAIADALSDELRRRSVPIRLGARVTRVRVERGRVAGVVLDDGRRLDCRHVVATCAGFEVVEHLLPAGSAPGAMRRKAARAPRSHRAVSIQLGCAAAGGFPDAFIVNHVPAMRQQGLLHVTASATPKWLAWTQPTQAVPGLAPPGRSIVELYAPATGIDAAADWTQAMTERATAHHLDALRARLPGLSVDTVRTLGPDDFAARRFLHDGALYGIAPGAPPHRYFPHRTAIDGLHLAGQTTFPGYGVAAALLSGIQAAEGLGGPAASTRARRTTASTVPPSPAGSGR